jgi:hypothetical protein
MGSRQEVRYRLGADPKYPFFSPAQLTRIRPSPMHHQAGPLPETGTVEEMQEHLTLGPEKSSGIRGELRQGGQSTQRSE